MNLSIKEIKQEARKMLEGKWKSVVLGLFVPFILNLLITFVPYSKNESYFSLFLQTSVFSFLTSLISYSFLIGVSNLILSNSTNEKRGGFFRVFIVSLSSLSRAIFPVFVLKFLYQTVDSFFVAENAILLYDTLFYSYIELPFYIFATQLMRLIISAIFFIFGIIYIFTPCIMAESPFISGKTAMQISARLTLKRRRKLTVLVFSFLGWIVVGFFAMFVGTFFAAAYETAAVCAFYKKVRPGMSISIKPLKGDVKKVQNAKRR